MNFKSGLRPFWLIILGVVVFGVDVNAALADRRCRTLISETEPTVSSSPADLWNSVVDAILHQSSDVGRIMAQRWKPVLMWVMENYLQKRADFATETPETDREILHFLGAEALKRGIELSLDPRLHLPSMVGAKIIEDMQARGAYHPQEEARIRELLNIIPSSLTPKWCHSFIAANMGGFFCDQASGGVREKILEISSLVLTNLVSSGNYDSKRFGRDSMRKKITFAYTAIHRKIIDELRRHDVRHRRNGIKYHPLIEWNLEARDESAEASWSHPFSREDLRAAVKRLPAGQAQLISMHFDQEMSLLEIAERLGEPEGTIKSRYQRALTNLRTWVKDQKEKDAARP